MNSCAAPGTNRCAATAVWSFLAAVVALALSLSAGTVHAQAQAKLQVTATVLKHVSMKVLAQPSSVVVTAADLARGYVDAPSPVKLTVRSNSRDGYLIAVAGQGDFLRRLRVRGLGPEVQIGPEGGFVRQASRSAVQDNVDLAFRFELAPGAREGVYGWPVQLSITPF
jgi:hypothetical protein